eukprot:UN28424
MCNTTTHLACEERFTHELELRQSEQLCLFCRLKMSDADVDARYGVMFNFLIKAWHEYCFLNL